MSGTVEDLLHSQDVVEIVLAHGQSANEVVEHLEIVEQVIEAQGDMLRVAGKVQAAVLAKLVEAGIGIASLNPLSRTLEDVYVQATRAADDTSSVLFTGTRGHGGKP